jgi:curved DNA-binding protein CbpA
VDSTYDYYSILEISRNESLPGIHRAYRRLAKQHHPDLAGAEGAARFRTIQEAYDVLSNPERKRRYDETLHAHRVKLHTRVEPLVTPSGHVARAEPLVESPLGMRRGGGRILRETCRTELYDFIRLAELLLSPLMLSTPLTEDEIWLMRQYLRELSDRYGV